MNMRATGLLLSAMCTTRWAIAARLALMFAGACGGDGASQTPSSEAGSSAAGTQVMTMPPVSGNAAGMMAIGALPPSGGSGTAQSAGTGAAGMRAEQPAKAGAAAGAGVAGAGGAGTAGAGRAGSPVAAAGSGGAPVAAGPGCKGMPGQAVIIGDSYINWPTHTLPADLATETGEMWRLYAVGGASLQAGGIIPQFIKDQLEQAIADDADIKLLVMDGGGNDVLLADTVKYPGSDACTSSGSSRNPICQRIVADTLTTFRALIARAAEIGVLNIVFFFYPTIPDGTLLGGPQPNEIADYARPMWKAACDGASTQVGGKLACHFVDMVPVFKGHDEWFAAGDIHPTPEGSSAMAKAIVDTMKQKCVWQPSGSMCCR